MKTTDDFDARDNFPGYTTKDLLDLAADRAAGGRQHWDAERDKYEGDLVDLENPGVSMTKQAPAEEVDINKMIERFGINDLALLPHALDPRYFGDFSETVDFREALDRTRDANHKFSLLPASIRNRFNNNPLDLWEFVSNPSNADEAVRLGLLAKREPPAPPAPPEETT